MKKHILTYLSSLILSASALAHGNVELGPNGGRILEFSKNESMHGEVIFKDNQFHIALLDKDMKPAALADQELTATSGERAKPEKLVVEKKDGKFIVPAVKAGDWIIFQYKENAKTKAITARLQYDPTICGPCKGPEWLCKCAAKEGKGK
ncbi:MAG: hypothetical protein ORN83_07935 [Chthoniobacteraceae bacterium]|nr:hypothetical protein [Chthoniobacteraceae bacterium]